MSERKPMNVPRPCLSLAQPYATMVVMGLQTVHLSPEATDVRGTIAVYASDEHVDPWDLQRAWDHEPEWWKPLTPRYRGVFDMPTRAVIGTVELTDVRPVLETAAAAVCARAPWPDWSAFPLWEWVLEAPTAITPKPVRQPARTNLLWDWDEANDV